MFSWEFSFCLFTSYAYIWTCIRRHLKETILWSSITWSEMGKQNLQAEKVYWDQKWRAIWCCYTFLVKVMGAWIERFLNNNSFAIYSSDSVLSCSALRDKFLEALHSATALVIFWRCKFDPYHIVWYQIFVFHLSNNAVPQFLYQLNPPLIFIPRDKEDIDKKEDGNVSRTFRVVHDGSKHFFCICSHFAYHHNHLIHTKKKLATSSSCMIIGNFTLCSSHRKLTQKTPQNIYHKFYQVLV